MAFLAVLLIGCCCSLQYTACAVPFARSTVNNGSVATPVCTSSLNGSYFQQFTKDNYYDDLLWAAAWMYKATGDAVRGLLHVCKTCGVSFAWSASPLHKAIA